MLKIKKNIFLYLISIIIVLFATVPTISTVIKNVSTYQWDFKVHYYAGRAFLCGLNPYVYEDLKNLSFGVVDMPFKFPPYTLFLYRIISLINFQIAYNLYLLVKVFLYFTLIMLWKRHFFKNTNIILFVLFIFFSVFSWALYTDFKAGNVTVVEQVFFWYGVLFLFKNKIFTAGLFILFSSLFKLLNIPLLFLLLLKGFLVPFLVFLIGLALFLLATWIVLPQESVYFLRVIYDSCSNWFTLDAPGCINPASLNFFRSIFIDWANIYIIFVSVVILISSIVIFLNYRVIKNNFLLVYFIISIYCLVMPRLKDYSLIIIMPSAYFILDYFLKNKKFSIFILFIFLYFPINFFICGNMPYAANNIIYIMLSQLHLPTKLMLSVNEYFSMLLCFFIWLAYFFIIYNENRVNRNA